MARDTGWVMAIKIRSATIATAAMEPRQAERAKEPADEREKKYANGRDYRLRAIHAEVEAVEEQGLAVQR